MKGGIPLVGVKRVTMEFDLGNISGGGCGECDDGCGGKGQLGHVMVR